LTASESDFNQANGILLPKVGIRVVV